MKCPECHMELAEESHFCSHCGTQLRTPETASISQTKTLLGPAIDIQNDREFAGKYKIIEKLGEGGMGVVYKALDKTLKRTVALKFLSPELTKDQVARKRFMQEAQAAAAIEHPNICGVYEIGDSNGQTFIAMTFVEGQSLKERLTDGPLSIDEALHIAIQLAEGLKEAHAQGIVHRDIKPANIMISQKGQVKITDFGLAKLCGSATLTRDSMIMGTVAYMSPEQARGEVVDLRTDIWSAGVVLYESLSGQLPFGAGNESAVLHGIRHEEPIPIRKISPLVPPELQHILEKAMNKGLDARYGTIEEMLRDLYRYRDSQTALQGITDIRSFLKIARRPRNAFLVGISIIMLAVIAIWLSRHSAERRWARNTALPQVMQDIDKREFLAAFNLMRRIDPILPGDSVVSRLWPEVSRMLRLNCTPGAARLSIRPLEPGEQEFIPIGPLADVEIRLPKGTYVAKIEAEGYEPFVFKLVTERIWDNFEFHLRKKDAEPQGMTLIWKGLPQIINGTTIGYEHIPGTDFDDYLIDRYEVTNRQYKEFIDSGGYQNQKYWTQEIRKDGQIFSWDEAMALFRDRTGRPGPSTWEFGAYPDGQDDYPVAGISWYEAAAYAEFAGKRLPTIYHWDRAAFPFFMSGISIQGSNFSRQGPAQVGAFKDSVILDTFDMAGNVAEWCSTAAQASRFMAGGAWSDPAHMFHDFYSKSPFDRSEGNGFRCIKLLSPKSTSEIYELPLLPIVPKDWSREKPLSDDAFTTWRKFLSYSDKELNAVIDFEDSSPQDWVIQRAVFDPVGEEPRMQAYLFLPKKGHKPYQVVIYWPGAAAVTIASSDEGRNLYDQFMWEYFVRDGRAVICPLIAGTYERGGNLPQSGSDYLAKISGEDFIIKQVRDVMRCCDYVQERPDLDKDRIAFVGYSWGGFMGSLVCSAEKRIKAGIFISGWLNSDEVFGWAHQVTIPILMINGRYDGFTMPYEEKVVPFFEALSTPQADKNSLLLETDHSYTTKIMEVIKENLAWLDKYLGPVNADVRPGN